MCTCSYSYEDCAWSGRFFPSLIQSNHVEYYFDISVYSKLGVFTYQII